jgi:transcriptional regulator with XRE-family HTH domain
VVAVEFFGGRRYASPMTPEPRQIRAARALIGWSIADLARAAGISATGLQAIEAGKSDPKSSTLDAIRAALEAEGVEFTNGTAPGVRVKSYKLKDAGQDGFLLEQLAKWVGFGAVDAGRVITVRVEDIALQRLSPSIGGGADHMSALETHRSKIFKIAARKYELGLVEPGEIISVRFDDVAG